MPGTYQPSQVDAAILLLETRCLTACKQWASKAQDKMRQDAGWVDRGGADSVTGKTARESLEAEAQRTSGAEIQIVLRSTRASTHFWRGRNSPVGAFLELTHRNRGGRGTAQRFPVIYDTLHHEAPALKEQLQAVMLGKIP